MSHTLWGSHFWAPPVRHSRRGFSWRPTAAEVPTALDLHAPPATGFTAALLSSFGRQIPLS